MAAARIVLTMADVIKEVVKWFAKHLYVRQIDLQGKRDEMSVDECEPKPATEVGVKFKW